MGKKPSKIKKLEGTFRNDRAPKNEMQPNKVGDVVVPKNLINDFAEKEWMTQTNALTDLGMLVETDLSMLLAYCNEIGIYFDCISKVKATGYTQESKANGEVISSFMKVGNTALNNAIKLSDKFGFNPAARTKIEAPPKPPTDILDDF